LHCNINPDAKIILGGHKLLLLKKSFGALFYITGTHSFNLIFYSIKALLSAGKGIGLGDYPDGYGRPGRFSTLLS
jgi:hypothetical protein